MFGVLSNSYPVLWVKQRRLEKDICTSDSAAGGSLRPIKHPPAADPGPQALQSLLGATATPPLLTEPSVKANPEQASAMRAAHVDIFISLLHYGSGHCWQNQEWKTTLKAAYTIWIWCYSSKTTVLWWKLQLPVCNERDCSVLFSEENTQLDLKSYAFWGLQLSMWTCIMFFFPHA